LVEKNMLQRPAWLAGLGAAVAVPYVATQGLQGNRPNSRGNHEQVARATTHEHEASAKPWGEPAHAEHSSDPYAQFSHESHTSHDPSAQLPGVPSLALADLLRFDVDPRWVNATWPRVSTVTAENHMMGLRVPVATGTNPTDISGALTYYFDRNHHVQRITLDGVVGDERMIADYVGQVYGLRQEQALEAGIYVTAQRRTIHNVMRVSFAPVLDVEQPLRQRSVWLELNRPERNVRLSDDSKRVLDFERMTQRW
jgi:hypothetical protein